MSQSKAFTKKEIREFGESLLEEIDRAFRGVSIKGGVTISEAYAIDDYEPDDVRAAARARDTYQNWTDVNVRQDGGGSALTFMDPIGFRFHMPAYMSLTVRVELGDTPYPDNNCLIKFEQSWMFELSNELHSEQFSLFDHAQRRAVARFLWFLAETSWHNGYSDGLEHIKPLRWSWWADLSSDEQRMIQSRWNIQKGAWPQ